MKFRSICLFIFGMSVAACVIALCANGAAQGEKEHAIRVAAARAAPEDEVNALLAEFGFNGTVSVMSVKDARHLELVNQEHPVSSLGEQVSLVSAWPDVPVQATDIMLAEVMLDAVRDLFIASNKVFNCSFYVGSGYRSYRDQEQLYEQTRDKSLVQPPNHSEHHTGLAADIFALGIGQFEMAGTPEADWLAENAWKYGLVQRYTSDKRDVTGIADEPWHFRYIGKVHAYYCVTNNLCMEEYILLLKENGGYQMVLDGVSYSVAYQVPELGVIYVPERGEYEISSDNTGGFVVTAWR